MNQNLPDPIKNLALLFRNLPGVGGKTALRFVYALLKEPRQKTENLAKALLALHAQIKTCSFCGGFSREAVCSICKDPKRDKALLCVVAESRDIAVIELTGEFNGRYFVLGGLLSPLEGSTPETIRANSLLTHLSRQNQIKEILLAFNSDMPGESTILFLRKQLSSLPVKLTTLARGLPLGADLEYADEVTLADALRGRRVI